jgi:hypothetical protein
MLHVNPQPVSVGTRELVKHVNSTKLSSRPWNSKAPCGVWRCTITLYARASGAKLNADRTRDGGCSPTLVTVGVVEAEAGALGLGEEEDEDDDMVLGAWWWRVDEK